MFTGLPILYLIELFAVIFILIVVIKTKEKKIKLMVQAILIILFRIRYTMVSCKVKFKRAELC